MILSANTWYKQVQACHTIEIGRTRIARILSKDEQITMVNLLKSTASDAWIGAIRLAEGNFYWYDRRSQFEKEIEAQITLDSVVGTYWATGQPDNYLHQENCVSLDRLNGWKWNDGGCGWMRRVVCETRC